MESDSLPDPTIFNQKFEITNQDIKKIVGNAKKEKKTKTFYTLSKIIIIIVGSLATLIFLISHYLTN